MRDSKKIKKQRPVLKGRLSESEKKYRITFEYTGTAMIVIEDDMVISMANKETERLTGYSTEEIVGTKWDRYVHKADLEKMLGYHSERRSTKRDTPTRYEFRLITKSGEIKNILYNVNLVPGTRQSIGSLIDITEQKMVEQALRNSEEKYRLLIESIEDGYYEVDLDGNILYYNEALARIYGVYEKSKYLGMNYRSFSDEKNASMLFKTFNRVFRSKRPEKSLHWELIRKDGQKRTLEVSVSLVKDYKGKLTGFRGIVRDVTERKQVEEKLKYLSMHDVMTGLYNRTYFEEEMDRINKGRFSPVTIICCDVDGLKIINDTLGHKKGDELLKSTAKILRVPFRASDVVARTGGDEFSIILPYTDEKAARRICERINLGVLQHNMDSGNLPISLSIGMATGNISETTGCDELYKEADNNMYRQKLRNRTNSKGALVKSLMKVLDERDFLVGGHAERLFKVAERMIESLNLTEKEKNDFRLMTLYHDIGKAGIPEAILFKKGTLDAKEWEEVKQHCEIGFRIAKSTPELSYIADWILYHHEWWNGKGYPQGLKGDEIPLLCRVFLIADAYDAMTTDRPYRKAISQQEALMEINRCAGIQFDPELVKIFLQVFEKEN
ncbi:MAG: sensor domain-containing diguanylate cyclase/phosphohydrolase [Bacillota bacterium]